MISSIRSLEITRIIVGMTPQTNHYLKLVVGAREIE